MLREYTSPPMRTQLFCRLDARTLDLLEWGDVVELLDGDISAPSAIPSGGVKGTGMFGDMTSFVPREWEAHQRILERCKAIGLIASSATTV